ncbi:hypothetical protein ASE04_19965 [Rhizobium sp. Root708]|nr:hypothetical protein ASE04_19965 [Rhizobium sp. Root708]
MASMRKRHSVRSQLAALALAATAGLSLASSAEAQTTQCTFMLRPDYLRTVQNPALSDRQEIMDLLHRYNWALDDSSDQGVENMLLDGATYETCAGRNQLEKKTGKAQVIEYLKQINSLMGDRGRRRHIESNTLLNLVDKDTVEGKSTIVVTIQFAEIETPVLDYTATMITTFKRDAGTWKFAMVLVLPDGPKVALRAR